jgi:hypothetical protein
LASERHAAAVVKVNGPQTSIASVDGNGAASKYVAIQRREALCRDEPVRVDLGASERLVCPASWRKRHKPTDGLPLSLRHGRNPNRHPQSGTSEPKSRLD